MPVQVSLFLGLSAIYVLLGWGIYLVFRMGEMYFAPVFTMGLGAYFTALALRDWGWSYGPSLLVAVALGGAIAFLIALALGRASGFALTIASLAPIVILQKVVRNVAFFGGARGIYPIPRVDHLMPIALTATALIGFFIYRLDHSRLGRAVEVISVNPDLAAAQGANRYKISIFLQTAAGAIGALAGAIYAPLMASISPPDFGFPLLLNIMCFLFVGGCTNMWGVVVFTPLLWGLRLVLPSEIVRWTMIIYGTLLIAVVLLRPEGVITKQALRSIRVGGQALLRQTRGLRQSGSGH